MDHFAEYSGVVLILLVGAFVLFGHWLACMWYAIGELKSKFKPRIDKGINTICNIKTNNLSSHNWLVRFAEDTNKAFVIKGGEECRQENIVGGPETMDSYLAALYFVMSSLTSVGFGNIAAYSIYEQGFRFETGPLVRSCNMSLIALLYSFLALYCTQ